MSQIEAVRGRDLKHERERAGLRQRPVAKAAGITDTVLIAIEKEQVGLTDELREKIQNAIATLSEPVKS